MGVQEFIAPYNSHGGDGLFCIVGLGNPGRQYQLTRHNAGFLVLDQIAKAWGVSIAKKDFQSLYGRITRAGQDIILVQPQTYMNLSGDAVGAIVRYFKIVPADLLVIYDDLDLPLGALRFRVSGSSGGHRGLTSVINCLGTNEIARIRLGIGRPPEGMAVADYVLTQYNAVEQSVLNEVITQGVKAAEAFIFQGAVFTMNHYNINLNKQPKESKNTPD